MRSFRAAPAAKVGLQFGSSRSVAGCCMLLFWRFTHLAHVAVTPFVARCPVFFLDPPLLFPLPRLSHTQKVVKMQIKLETNWAGRQHTHTQCSFCVCICVVVWAVALWGGVFRLVHWISCFANDMNSLDNDCWYANILPGAMYTMAPPSSAPTDKRYAHAFVYFGSK